MRIPIFDHHVHMDSRNANDYEMMAVSGVEAVLVPCTFSGQQKRTKDAYFEYFKRLLGLEKSRASVFGIEFYAGLSINSGDIGDIAAANEAVGELSEYLLQERVCALGELSLKSYSKEEVAIFVRQLKLAKELSMPVMIEAPPGKGTEQLEKLIAVLRGAISDHDLDPRSWLMVDLHKDTLPLVWDLELGGYGIPVSPKLNGLFAVRPKMDAKEVKEILDQYGVEKILFNSALHFGFGDPLCISRVLLHLNRMGVSDEVLKKCAYDNAVQFFSQSKNFQLKGNDKKHEKISNYEFILG